MSKEELAGAYFRQGYNCNQAVLLAFQDVLGLDEQTILKIGTGLGGGMARMREVCGTVSAMAVIAGFLSPATTPGDQAQRRDGYALVQKFASEFKEQNGSIVCRELLGKPQGWEAPEPSERTPQFYAKRPCEAYVRNAARIVENFLENKIQKF